MSSQKNSQQRLLIQDPVYRILIVEDEEIVGKYFQQILSTTFHVEWVLDAKSAEIRLWEAPKVDAILLDMVLPNGRGLDLIIKFRRQHPELAIVSISGYPFTDAEVIQAGAQEFIRKPIASLDLLSKMLAQAIARMQVSQYKVDAHIKDIKDTLDDSVVRLTAALTETPSGNKLAKRMEGIPPMGSSHPGSSVRK